MAELVTGKEQYKEFRKDGWPLCPNCGEDELWSRLTNWLNGHQIAPEPTMDDYINDGLQCYRCQWQSLEVRKPYVIKVAGLDKLKAALDKWTSA